MWRTAHGSQWRRRWKRVWFFFSFLFFVKLALKEGSGVDDHKFCKREREGGEWGSGQMNGLLRLFSPTSYISDAGPKFLFVYIAQRSSVFEDWIQMDGWDGGLVIPSSLPFLFFFFFSFRLSLIILYSARGTRFIIFNISYLWFKLIPLSLSNPNSRPVL